MLTLDFLPSAAPQTALRAIHDLAQRMRDEVNTKPAVLKAVAAAHVARADGAQVQAPSTLRKHGFEFEKTGLFVHVEVPGLRPDLFHQGLGIIGEFERGGTLTNNRDLLDFYKVHICEQARHLFLFVPQTIHGRQASRASAKRIRAVLREQSGVDSVALFGY